MSTRTSEITSPSDDRDPIGVLLCLLAASVYAVSLVVQKPLVGRLSAVQITWIACTVGAIVTLLGLAALVYVIGWAMSRAGDLFEAILDTIRSVT